MAEDPAIERLRDALGALRTLYAATSPKAPAERTALKAAGSALKSALSCTELRSREKVLPQRLAIARREVRAAATAVPWASRALHGVLAHLRPLGGREAFGADDEQRPVPLPPFWTRDEEGSNSGPAGDDEGA